MPSKIAIIAFCLLATLSLALAQHYRLQSAFTGPAFFDNFDFWTAGDPTIGYVHYVDRATAEQHDMINSTGSTATWGVDTTQILDPMANLGRLSVRLTSVQSWTHGLFILDLAHMPANECGVWPAWWMLGSGTWPANGELTRRVCAAGLTTADSSNPGEIDIIETTNDLPNNLMALHTSQTPDCTVAGADQSGTLLTANCAVSSDYRQHHLYISVLTCDRLQVATPAAASPRRSPTISELPSIKRPVVCTLWSGLRPPFGYGSSAGTRCLRA